MPAINNLKKSSYNSNIYSSSHSNAGTSRDNLGKHYDVACFIMAIEIERLINENDKLKYRLKEVDDKLLDRNSYEKQIEDL
jgi:hypothetical protein